MTITVWMDSTQSTLYTRLAGEWTLTELRTAHTEGYRLANTARGPMDIVLDLSDSTTLTADLLLAASPSALAHVEIDRLPNQRLVVVVGASLLLRTIIQMLGAKAPWVFENVCYADTVEEANTLLQTKELVPAKPIRRAEQMVTGRLNRFAEMVSR
jgi:hypothetical protein